MADRAAEYLEPSATFDCLYLASKLQQPGGAFTSGEVHLFAYLSCLLWIYSGRSSADWGYGFVGTERGAPFSLEIDMTLRRLEERGFVGRAAERMHATSMAEESLRDFADLEMNKDRSECLFAAWSTTKALSVGIVGTAIAEEPELRRAREVPTARRLLEEAALSVLYDQFAVLRLLLKDDGLDLRVPAVVWLEALHRVRESSPE
jgi:hypothetical protein